MDIYLDSIKKAYYLSDFNNNVLLESESFWKVNESVKETLCKINDNSAVQTLYSKFPDGSNFELESYFEFCYEQIKEQQIFRKIIPYFIIKYNNHDNYTCCTYMFNEPRDNPNHNPNTKSKMGCITNSDYFRINSIRIDLTGGVLQDHQNFWNDLLLYFKEV